jgi:hypothetical protein
VVAEDRRPIVASVEGVIQKSVSHRSGQASHGPGC